MENQQISQVNHVLGTISDKEPTVALSKKNMILILKQLPLSIMSRQMELFGKKLINRSSEPVKAEEYLELLSEETNLVILEQDCNNLVFEKGTSHSGEEEEICLDA